MTVRGVAIVLTIVLALLMLPQPAFCQLEDIRSAIVQQDNIGALRMLSGISYDDATADVYLYRGIVYANLREFTRAMDAFREGAHRYPADRRFHDEGLAFYRRSLEIVAAKAQLHDVLRDNPDDTYALELLASLDLSDGNISPALNALNRAAQPQLARVLDNYEPVFSSSILPGALAFHAGDILTYRNWKTTEARLDATGAFNSTALDLEPSLEPNKYNANIRTQKKGNTWSGIAVGLLKGLPVETSYLDLWNIAGSLVQLNSSYRWNSNRRRAEGKLSVPFARFHVVLLELGMVWRSELWELPSHQQFRYKASAFRAGVNHITDNRIEVGAGIEYQSRAPAPDAGKLLFHIQYRPLDGRIKSQMRLDGFGARASLVGHSTYEGVSASVANRIVLAPDAGAFLDLSIKAGTLRGHPAIEDFFILGVDNEADYLLRGHTAVVGGVYGRSPMGTDFVLMNNDVERRVAKLPFFKTPISGELFADVAKVFDRTRLYTQAGWLLDVGGGAKMRMQDTDFTVLYGRSLTTGSGVVSTYIEHRFW